MFASTEEVAASWKFIDPIVQAWEAGVVPLVPYKPGAKALPASLLGKKKVAYKEVSYVENLWGDDYLVENNVLTPLKKISNAIYNGLRLKGFNIAINQFKAGGQVVPHLHIHIIPRNENDGVRLWPTREYEDEGERKSVQEKITKLLI